MKVLIAMMAFFTVLKTSHAITCRTYLPDEATSGYTLPWLSGVSRLVTASVCSPTNSFHSTSATWMYKINDATFAYDFRMRYEPVCTMSDGWIIEFRDREPDLEGTNQWGTSNFFKVLTPRNRVDYYTHLRQSWWTERGEPEYNYINRRGQILALASAKGKVRWGKLFDGRYRLVHANGRSLTFSEYRSLAAQGYLDDIYVPRAHCIAWSGSSGTRSPHLHVESRCSLSDSRTCPLQFENAHIAEQTGAGEVERGLLGELNTYLAR